MPPGSSGSPRLRQRSHYPQHVITGCSRSYLGGGAQKATQLHEQSLLEPISTWLLAINTDDDCRLAAGTSSTAAHGLHPCPICGLRFSRRTIPLHVLRYNNPPLLRR